MYLASAVLKHFENQGRRATDLPLVEWSVRTLMYQAQEALHAFLRNFPNRFVATILRVFIFPRGRTYSAPSDALSQRVVALITKPGEARERLCQLAYTTNEPSNPLGLLQETLELSVEFAPIERRIRLARKDGQLSSDYLGDQIDEAETTQLISKAEAKSLRAYHKKVLDILDVDDFAPDELARTPVPGFVPRRAATTVRPAKKTSRTKSTRKKTGNKKKPAPRKPASKQEA
jgi:acyl-CoA dehydrogenase